jgi:inner membrane protease ATP23
MSEATSTTDPALLTAAKEVRQRDQARYKERCDKYVQKGLTKNKTIQFLIEKLIGLGCEPPKGFIQCMDCGDKMAGGGFGMVQETILDSNNVEDSAQQRAVLPQCQRSVQDLKDQLHSEQAGKSKLKLLPEIFLCQQHLRNETHAHQSMTHELIHAIDMCR